MEEGNMAAVLPVLEEGESLEAKVARLEREKEKAEAREKEGLVRERVAAKREKEERRGRETVEEELWE